MRAPDLVAFRSGSRLQQLERKAAEWRSADLTVRTQPSPASLAISVSAESSRLEHILLRWHISLPNDAEFLGDQWERSYGDLAWRSSVPNRIMPWYFLMTSGRVTSGFGVRVGAPALAFWQADPEGISLWLDVRNGGSPVQLSGRALEAVHVVTVSQKDVSPFSAARQLCKLMSPAPRLPKLPVYGGNNWYYTYGENFTASDIVRDGELLAECADGAANRPYMVIDMGWERADEGAGPTNETNNRFPDMPALVAKLNKIGVRPGIWLRPLLTTEKLPESWRMASSAKRMKEGFFVIDPSIPEALAHIQDSVKVVKEWGFNLIKHDFSTYDMLGRWGFDMGATLTDPNWNFADKSRTTAEIIRSFYAGLREAAGDALLLGCNTMGHLGAGLFELQRIGDDTSGRDWERTRKMGVNTLAFRLPQHNTFFSADADCVAITPQVPWNMTRQWLDLVARSGTALFVSADPKSIGPEQKTALRAAFQSASKPRGTAEPVDWRETTAPEKWVIGGSKATYQWYLPEGASPFGT